MFGRKKSEDGSGFDVVKELKELTKTVFKGRGYINAIAADVAEMGSKVRRMEEHAPPQELVTCSKCGCAVLKENARKGKSEIKERRVWNGNFFAPEEYICTPLYCKMCNESLQVTASITVGPAEEPVNTPPKTFKVFTRNAAGDIKELETVQAHTAEILEHVLFFLDLQGDTVASFAYGHWTHFKEVEVSQ